VEPGGPLTRAQVVSCIVLGLVCVVLAIAAVTFMDSRASFPPTTPEHAVEAFVDAFNAQDFEKLCKLSSPEIRQRFDSVGFDAVRDLETVERAIDRSENRPDLVGCLMGAEEMRSRIGHISSGAVSKTARETRVLAYATTHRGRWKLTSDGDTWKVARHPRLETLADDG
jgi:hypothetical protein